MYLNRFQELSKRTMPKPNEKGEYSFRDMANYAMGLAGEAGETTDLIKKHLFHAHPLDKDEVKKELGDVMHYVAGLATMFGLSFDEITDANIEKLKKRYPNGFNFIDSMKRVDIK